MIAAFLRLSRASGAPARRRRCSTLVARGGDRRQGDARSVAGAGAARARAGGGGRRRADRARPRGGAEGAAGARAGRARATPATPRTAARSARGTRSRALARDLVALDGVDLGPAHPLLGPADARADGRPGRHGAQRRPGRGDAACSTCAPTPRPSRAETGRARCAAAVAGELRVVSDRLRAGRDRRPRTRSSRAALARPAGGAALRLARRSPTGLLPPASRRSRCGPGRTERSHTRRTSSCWKRRSSRAHRFYEALVARPSRERRERP